MEITAKKLPVRTPICRTSDICAITDGARETNAPLPKPKSAANTMIGALDVAGSQSARMIMPVKPHMMIIILNRPILSARKPGTVRPKKETAFKIGTMYCASFGFMP